jgi:hypothetical protein
LEIVVIYFSPMTAIPVCEPRANPVKSA